MKYIRMKDERIGTSWEIAFKPNMISFGQPHKFRQEISKDDVLKQADTIEELCDEVCCDNKVQLLVNHYTNETKAQMIKNTFEELFYKGKKDVFGAIWTSKGLIYVAKMNGKGELELL